MQQQQIQHGRRSPFHASQSQSQPETSSSDPRSGNMLVGLGGVGTQHMHHHQQLKLGDPSPSQHAAAAAAAAAAGVAEAASPISSRPPAVPPHLSTAGSFEQFLPAVTSGDDDMFGGDEVDYRGSVSVSGGNRWPRQETLALLKIRLEMDVSFRDATLKGPLWEDVSRKLAELGYERTAKKCKEKFENVHKYYKRTKEGRAGRQDGKSYRFFSQLEALHSTTISSNSNLVISATTTPPSAIVDATSVQFISPVPVSIGIGVPNLMSVSSVEIPPLPQAQALPGIAVFPLEFNTGGAVPALVLSESATALVAPPLASATKGVSFSSESDSPSSYSSSSGSEKLEDVMELERGEGEPAPITHHQLKRKRASSLEHHLSSSDTSSNRLTEFFEGLMKQVMQKQEAMQQRFLEAIEKREQDRMIRDEAWKRQEMARLAREHDLLSQERAISSSRDAAIIAFLQKITGQTIPLPSSVTIPEAPPPPLVVPAYQPPPSPPQPPASSEQRQKPQQQQQPQHYLPQQQNNPHLQHHHHHHGQQPQQLHSHRKHHSQSADVIAKNHQPAAPLSLSEIVVAVPEVEVQPAQETSTSVVGESIAQSSTRWPKAEVLALIKLRSGLESKYQEAGPKGPLWEEISVGIHRMGYKRNAKRCKEKWENINKYFKKVKESNKKRPEDAKTCPYFHELDALYRKKILGTTSSTSTFGVNIHLQQQIQEISIPKIQDGSTTDLQKSNGCLTASLFGEGSEGTEGGPKKPEDNVEEQQSQNHPRQLMMSDYGDIEETTSDYLSQEEDEYNDENDDLDDVDDDDDDETEEETKMAYRIQFQRQNTGSSNGGGGGAPSFLAMVQ